MAIVITVRVYHRWSNGDTSSHIEEHTISGSALDWWKQRSGKGDFDLLSARPINSWKSLL